MTTASSARAARFDLILTFLGIAALLLAVAWIVAAQLAYDGVVDANPIPEALGVVSRIPAALFLITALNGLHGRQRSEAGAVGRAAQLVMIIGLIGFAVVVGPVWVIGWLVLHLGAVLFGLAVLRAGVFARGPGFTLLLGVPAAIVGGYVLQRALSEEPSGWGVFAGTVAMTVALAWLAVDAARPAPGDEDVLAQPAES